MPHLLIATSNPGKLRDFAAAATEGFEMEPLPGLATILPPEETAATFEGNASDKAVYYSRFAPGEIVLADDSGLEVDALNGAPGVHSARYSPPANTEPSKGPRSPAQIDLDNNNLLIHNLIAVPDEYRTARYRCVLAAARDGNVFLTAEGTVEGVILTQPQGTGGFGYDPLFYLPTLNKTMAAIDLQTKDALSHRGIALRSLLRRLKV